MPEVPVNNVHQFGVLKDLPMYKLPPAAWAAGENVRILAHGIGAYGLGWVETLNGATLAPNFLQYIKGPTQPWWLYTTSTKAYVISSGTHTEITRAAGLYTASLPEQWNGTILGGVAILNNGLDIPQYWGVYSSGQLLQNLTNWPTTLRAKVIRALGPYLMAANLTDSGTNQPHRVRWSHPADPGSVPVSWDPTDATKDSRQVDLPDVNSGLIVDMLPLKEAMYVYKESSIHRFRPNGGRTVFSRDTLSETAGCLTSRCVAMTGNGQQHISLAQDDLVTNDGVRLTSLLSNRWKRYLFNQISTTNLAKCFMQAIPEFNEVMFAYPEAGFDYPNRGLLWNYSDGGAGTLTEITLDDAIVGAAIGDLTNSETGTWADLTATWDDALQPWNVSNRRKVVLINKSQLKFMQFDGAATRDGVAFQSVIQRTGLPLYDKSETGEALVDFNTMKLFTRLWLRVEGSPVQVRIGYQTILNGSTTWSTAQTFDPAVDRYVDFDPPMNGIAMALEISSEGQWLLTGYTAEVHPAGSF